MPRIQQPSGIHHLMECKHTGAGFVATALLLAACSGGGDTGSPNGNGLATSGTPGTTTGTGTVDATTTSGVGGTSSTVTGGGATTTTGDGTTTTAGVGGAATTTTGDGTTTTTGADAGGATSTTAAGGATSTTAAGAGGTVGGFAGGGGDGTIGEYMLDCGPDGEVIESHGPPANRVNMVIVGEGYDSSSIETTFIDHVNGTLDRRYNHESGEPFARYRNFVNICAMKSAGDGTVGSPFNGSISGRVSSINENSVDQWLSQHLPMDLEADWEAASFNITSWNNVGGRVVLFAGGNDEAAGALLHEGGHGFFQLADEYGTCTGAGCGSDTNGTGPTGTEYGEIDMTGNPMTTAGKWDRWIGSTQKGLKVPDMGATGLQSTWSGGRYEAPDSGQYRPSDNSMMNSLFGTNVNTSFNSISREQIIYRIWEAVKPIDETNPPAGAVNGAQTLQVLVIDPAVINVDWYVDGALVAENGGTSFDLAASGLAAGTYTIKATAHDNATEDLVRYTEGTCPQGVTQRYCHSPGWLNSTEDVEWTVTLP